MVQREVYQGPRKESDEVASQCHFRYVAPYVSRPLPSE
jgi:hypothetical protein